MQLPCKTPSRALNAMLSAIVHARGSGLRKWLTVQHISYARRYRTRLFPAAPLSRVRLAGSGPLLCWRDTRTLDVSGKINSIEFARTSRIVLGPALQTRDNGEAE